MGGVSQRGVLAATAILAGASCYALLLALAGLGFAENSIANMEALVDRPLMTVVAINVLLVGWVVALRRRASPRALVMLGVITALAGAAIAMALCEQLSDRSRRQDALGSIRSGRSIVWADPTAAPRTPPAIGAIEAGPPPAPTRAPTPTPTKSTTTSKPSPAETASKSTTSSKSTTATAETASKAVPTATTTCLCGREGCCHGETETIEDNQDPRRQQARHALG
jgi:hypothetical protein